VRASIFATWYQAMCIFPGRSLKYKRISAQLIMVYKRENKIIIVAPNYTDKTSPARSSAGLIVIMKLQNV